MYDMDVGCSMKGSTAYLRSLHIYGDNGVGVRSLMAIHNSWRRLNSL